MQQPLVLFILCILCILCIDVHKKISIPWRRCRSIQVAEMGGAVPGVVRAGRPRSQEAFIHTKNREHGLHHAGESGKTPYASLEYHSPLEGESARPGPIPQSSRWGANAAPREGRPVGKPSAVNLLQPRLRRSPLNLDTADGQDLNESCCKPFCILYPANR